MTLLIAYVLVLRKNLTTYGSYPIPPALRILMALVNLAVLVGVLATVFLTDQSLRGGDTDPYRWIPYYTALAMLSSIIGTYLVASLLFILAEPIAWLSTRNPIPFLRIAYVRLKPPKLPKKQLAELRRTATKFEGTKKDRAAAVSHLEKLRLQDQNDPAIAKSVKAFETYLIDVDKWLSGFEPPEHLKRKAETLGLPTGPSELLEGLEQNSALLKEALRDMLASERKLLKSKYHLRRAKIMLMALAFLEYENEHPSQVQAAPKSVHLPSNDRIRRIKFKRARRN
ncbi:hypothetical protein [Serinicoccus sp. LYQ131]|uniref:hypothetical protein n=1 Tax=Serinicoccus sp. LYQ131 TaxID=3378797 RepID=UPI0038521B3B